MVEGAVVRCTLNQRIWTRKLLSNVVRSARSHVRHTEGGNLRQVPLVVIRDDISSLLAIVRIVVLRTDRGSHHAVLGWHTKQVRHKCFGIFRNSEAMLTERLRRGDTG